jgi:hypothetical protein
MIGAVPCLFRQGGPALFYGVIATVTKWMATQNSPYGHEKTAAHTVTFDGIYSILGTGWRKTASRWEERRNQELIRPNERKQKICAAFLQKIFH